jgi:hypothetical protein
MELLKCGSCGAIGLGVGTLCLDCRAEDKVRTVWVRVPVAVRTPEPPFIPPVADGPAVSVTTESQRGAGPLHRRGG